jgi:N-acetylglutamate synthase-like GNAT family acetyltransferase
VSEARLRDRGMPLRRVAPDDLAELTSFLREADLTLSGLDAASVRLWVDVGDEGRVRGSTGYELSADGAHALIRSVAVDPAERSVGRGAGLARFAFAQAAAEGARTAWLFSRRSGPFWQRLGFAPADLDELASVLAGTHQVELFRQTGQLDREVAWSRSLAPGVG